MPWVTAGFQSIVSQLPGRKHEFHLISTDIRSSEGTGGTIAGVSCALKARRESIQVQLVDPDGSGLYNKVTRGVMFTCQVGSHISIFV